MPKGKLDFSSRTTIKDFQRSQATINDRRTAQAAAQNYLANTEWLVVAASRGGPALPPDVLHLRTLAEAELKQ